MGRFVDLTGKRFGRWTVIGRAESRMSAGKPVVFWKCKCDCGTERDVSGNSLRCGLSESCGCLHKEKVKSLCESRRLKNRFFIDGNVVHVQTKQGEFLCDKQDWSDLSKYYWQIGKDGYPVSCINKKFKKFHVLILDCPKGFERDHINGNRTDNRRENLRVIPASANRFNKGMNSRNKSGHTGVFWYERYKKYQVSIKARGKTVHLGYYEDYDEAVRVREEAEMQHFGEYRRK